MVPNETLKSIIYHFSENNNYLAPQIILRTHTEGGREGGILLLLWGLLVSHKKMYYVYGRIEVLLSLYET